VAAAVLVCAAALITPAYSAAVGPPLITATWVEAVGTKGARLLAEINPNGLPTKYHFEYISDAAYQANPEGERFLGAVKTPEKKLEGGSTSTELNSINSALTPATTYHYRAVANHEGGAETTIGPEHTFTTKGFGEAFRLPDNRVWEMVSPVDKGGGAIAGPGELFGGGDIQAAAVAPVDPARPLLTYGAAPAFGEAAGAPPVSQYIGRRSPFSWTAQNVSTPLASGAYGDEPDGAPYRVFSADLSRALIFGGLPCRGGLESCPAPNPPLPGSGAPAGYMAYYLRDSASGAVSSLLSATDVAHSGVSPSAFEVTLSAANPDLSAVVLSSCAALSADAIEVPDGPGRCDPGEQNLYEWTAGGLKAINLRPGDVVTTPGAQVAAPNGVVSSDGSRVYWTDAAGLYVREGVQTHQLDLTLGGGGTFQVASADGSVAFFTKAGHLYRYDSLAQSATDLTPGGGVAGVLGASADGAYLYFQDAAGLQLWHAGATATIAAGAAAQPSNYPPATGAARVSADGLHLAFLSDIELAGHDNLDADTKKPVTEVYLYGPAPGGEEKLVCASCPATGERPAGGSSLAGALANGTTLAYKPRSLSAAGTRLFFISEDQLVPSDTNGAEDPSDHRSAPDLYQWEANGVGGCQRAPGCVDLISAGKASDDSITFLDATADGSDVFFLTGDSLAAEKLDPGSIDVYDARVNGGLPEAKEPIVCVGDNCQSLPREPDDPTPGSLVRNPGNPPLRIFAPKKKFKFHRRHHRHHGHGGRKHSGAKRAGRRAP
jgi:hypothetical protein